jgi:3-oxoadipate enol-lactonase
MTTALNANGININYKLEGAVNAPVVVLSNSLLSNYHMWDDQIEALTNKFQVLRYDTRGHGGTDAPTTPYSLDIFVEDVIGLLDGLGIEKVHFVGLSMGGFLAQPLAVKYPDRLLSLVLCDTACHMPVPAVWDDRIAAAQKGGVESLVDGNLERWFTVPFRNAGGAQLEAIKKMIAATSLQGFVNCVNAFKEMSQCDILGEIKTPTLVIVGADDPSCPVAAAEILHAGIVGSQLEIIPDAAHLPNIEQKDQFNEILLKFLNN